VSKESKLGYEPGVQRLPRCPQRATVSLWFALHFPFVCYTFLVCATLSVCVLQFPCVLKKATLLTFRFAVSRFSGLLFLAVSNRSLRDPKSTEDFYGWIQSPMSLESTRSNRFICWTIRIPIVIAMKPAAVKAPKAGEQRMGVSGAPIFKEAITGSVDSHIPLSG
jgi:hypothetical protein